jgi:hypothetical protein
MHYVTAPTVRLLSHYLGDARSMLSRSEILRVDSLSLPPLVSTVVPPQPRPPAVTRTIQNRPYNLMQAIYSSLMMLFPKKPVTATIAGLTLTNDGAKILVNICQTLERLLVKQTAEIEAFPDTTGNDSFRALCHVQERHSRVTNQLEDLIRRVAASTEPWLKELGDVEKTMKRKVMVCNCVSKPMAMGWKEAGKQYWPLINESYAALFDLLESLKQELEDALKDEALWTEEGKKEAKKLVRRSGSIKSNRATPKTSLEGKHVRFEKNVQGRYFHRTETIHSPPEHGKRLQKSKEFTTALSNDRKDSTQKFKHRAAARRRWVQERAVAESEIDREIELEMEREREREAELALVARAQDFVPM